MPAVATATTTITAPRDAWVSMLTAANRVANAKPIPVLACAHLQAAEGGGLSWWVTDTLVSHGGAFAAVDISGAGTGLLPVAPALAMIKSCVDGPVSVTLSDHGDARVKAGSFNARIPSYSVEDFPLPMDIGAPGLPLPRAVLARIIAEVLPSVDPASSRYYLRGAMVSVSGESVLAVSTDGHQLSKSAAPLPALASEAVTILVPHEGLAHLAAMLRESEAPDVFYAERECGHVFRVGDEWLTVRPIDGQFPLWERVLPKTSRGRAVCDRHALTAALRRVELSAATREVRRVVFNFDGDALQLSGQSVERGDAADVVPIDLQGDGLRCILNARYVQNFLALADTEQVAIEFTSDVSPVVFRPVGDTPTDYLHVVMVMSY